MAVAKCFALMVMAAVLLLQGTDGKKLSMSQRVNGSPRAKGRLGHFAHQESCASPVSAGEDRRKDKTKLTVAEWNVEWLFVSQPDVQKAGVLCPGSCIWPDESFAEDHVIATAQKMRELDADVYILAEVQGCEVLRRLVQAVGDSSLRYYLVPGTDTYTGQNVALITRLDPLSSLFRLDESSSYPVTGSLCGSSYSGKTGCSKHFVTTLNASNILIDVAGVHFLSRPTDPGQCTRREAQCQTFIKAINNRRSNYLYAQSQGQRELIVAGDMNDYDGATRDVNNNKPTSRVLSWLSQLQGGLLSAASKVDQADRFTNWWDRNGDCVDEAGKEHSSIDHMLMTKGLFKRIRQVKIKHDIKPADFCSRTGEPTSLFSDHWPTIVTFET